MATISKRGDFQWQAKVRVRGQKTVSNTFSLKADAERWARQVEGEIERGVFVDRSEAEATTIFDALTRYESEVSMQKKGYKQEKSVLNRLRNSALAIKTLAGLKGADIATWRDARLKRVSGSTVNRELSTLSHLFTVAAKDWGMGIINPLMSVRKPKVEKGRERRLSTGDEDKLLIECNASSPELKAIAVVAIETGARLGELLGLERSNVNLKKRTIRFLDTKNGEDRSVPLSSRAVAAFAGLDESSALVFNRWKAADSFNKVWVRACKRADIEDLRFHDLRHEAISRLADKFAMHELMKITGHKSSAMLARYYHPRAEDLAKRLD